MTDVALPHRGHGRTPLGRYALASVGLAALASANGAARELTYGQLLSERTAHQLSFVPMVALFAAYIAWLERRWPLPTARGALAVGGLWAGIALGFEAALGHYVEGGSWGDVLHDYDLSAGRVGGLVLLTAAAGPLAVRARLRRRQSGSVSSRRSASA